MASPEVGIHKKPPLMQLRHRQLGCHLPIETTKPANAGFQSRHFGSGGAVCADLLPIHYRTGQYGRILTPNSSAGLCG